MATEACLSRTADRGPLLLTLGAAGATLLVGAILLGGPAVTACAEDSRGLVACLRGMVDDRFDLGIEPETVARPEAPAIVADTPTPLSKPMPEDQVADAPPAASPTEPTLSPTPQVADTPVAPAPAKPEVVPATPSLPEATAGETAERPPNGPAEIPSTPEVIALAKVDDPAAEAVPAVPPVAPSFVPPPLPIEIAGVPPDLTTSEPAATAPAFALPAVPDLPVSPPPDLQVARSAVAEPAPAFDLPKGPELPVTPPPDLTVAAIDPAPPPAAAPPAVPVLAPSIDAVEIEGDGNFIAGNGPAGATMRLYVDGIPVGISPVEGGRWLVEGTDLLTQ